jgi:hypothetical protein
VMVMVMVVMFVGFRSNVKDGGIDLVTAAIGTH